MHEILFRGKRTDTREWVKGSFVTDLMEVYLDKSLVDWGSSSHLAEKQWIDYEVEVIGNVHDGKGQDNG